MKNIVSRWFFIYFYVFMIVGFSAICLGILNAQSTSRAEIAKHLIIPLMKGNDNRFNSIQDIQVSPETHKQNSALTHSFFQQYPGRIPVHTADLNNYIKSNMKYDFQ